MKIAFVDPLASSTYLAQTLRKNNIESIAILTPQLINLYSYFTSHLAPYEYDYLVRMSDSTLGFLKALNPAHVFYGFELSIPEADQIVQKILPSQVNDLHLTNARVNKFEMNQRLCDLKLPYAISQVKVTAQDLPKLKETLRNFEFPLYVKPALSAASLGGQMCVSYEDLYATLSHYLGNKHEAYLVQECVTGEEYCIDTVSIKGSHHIIGMCKYLKKQIHHKVIPHIYNTVAPHECSHWTAIEQFIRKTLTALGYVNGFAHTEFFLREDGTLKLIEVNFRISGAMGYINKMFSLAYGKNVVDVLQYARANTSPLPLVSQGFANRLNLQNWRLEERPLNKNNTEKLLKVPSYQEHVIYRSDQTVLPSFANFKQKYDSAGQVLLFNKNLKKLNEDTQVVEDLFDRREIF